VPLPDLAGLSARPAFYKLEALGSKTSIGTFSGPAGDQDASAFWVDTSSFLKGNVSQAASLGQTICSALESGESEGKVIANIANGNQANVSDDEFVVHAAEWHYCPDHY
jgi:hypothetical protein